ncbi:AAA family ATPase [Paenibacillus sp. NRS-1782]|uniref:AAA family ATPase n=1 Tax=unclassified Paenibacillus TaxID=185978 RepID=UPI003D29FFE3
MDFELDDVVDRRWMVKESSLDDEQYAIRILRNRNLLIEGCAGSGKTVLALQKAKELEDSGITDYLIVLYTRALLSFVKDGVLKLGIDPDKVWNFDQLEVSGYTEVDYIIVDEVQDFNELQLHKLIQMAKKNFIFFGDDAQQIYDQGLNLKNVMKVSKLQDANHKKLTKNYRLPKTIARFASYIKNDSDLVTRCVNEGGEPPRIIKCNNFFEELNWMKTIIEKEYWTDVAILVHNNDLVHEAEQYLKKLGLDVEKKVKEGNRNIENLDFYSSKPKLMTYHSSKGLQFEHVFMPGCEISTTKHNYQQAVYVATTRASETLDILYSNQLSPFISCIPKDLYDFQELNNNKEIIT